MGWEAQLLTVAVTAYAMLLGGVIGYERELKDRPAGFRTHMLVAGGAALLVGIGRLTLHDPSLTSAAGLSVDPLRSVEAVIAGVAFIGAGTIFAARGENSVAGITTAASLLMVSIIGVAAGFSYHVLAIAATVLTLLVLTVLNLVESRSQSKKPVVDVSETNRKT